MKSSKRVFIIAIILGLITAGALYFYIESLAEPAQVSVPYVEVIVAKKTIPENVRITADMLERKNIHADAVHPDAIRTTDAITGAISKTEIVQGEQILSGKFVVDASKATMSYRIPINMRAITIPVTEVIGVAGFISPGDRIDVLISYDDSEINRVLTTYTVFQNIEVLATGEKTVSRDNDSREVVSTLTLLVTPAQAEVVAYSVIKGRFHLTLRSVLDTQDANVRSFSADNFGTYRER